MGKKLGIGIVLFLVFLSVVSLSYSDKLQFYPLSLVLTVGNDAGNQDIENVRTIYFNLSSSLNLTEGQVGWDPEDGTLEVGLKGGNVNLQIGQENVIRVKASENVLNGQVVYIDGADGSNPTISLANGSNPVIADKTIGVATEDISTNQFGYVTTFGLVRELDTSSYTEGQEVYLSTTELGNFTSTEGDIKIGVIVRSQVNEGVLFTTIRTAGSGGEVNTTNLVPYTGATQDVELGNYDLYSTNGTLGANEFCLGGDCLNSWSSTTGASETYVQSRGEQLITNGRGQMLSNYNFDDYGFVRDEAVDSFGSFSIICTNHNLCYNTSGDFRINDGRTNDEYIAVDTSKSYKLSVWGKANETVPTTYFGIVAYDSDYKSISASTHQRLNNGTIGSSDTYLSQDLKIGDTEVCMVDLGGWVNNTATRTYQRSIIFFNYTNDQGYTYPDFTYSRYLAPNDLWNDVDINYTSNCITLKSAWTYSNPKHVNGTWTAGFPLSQKSSGAQYKYIANPTSDLNETWQLLSGAIGRLDTSGSNLGNMFSPGTAFIKLLFLNNYAGTKPIQIWYSSFDFKEMPVSSELTSPGSGTYTSISVPNGGGEVANIKVSYNGYLGINTDDISPDYPLVVGNQKDGIGLYVEYDVSADDFIDRSDVSTDKNILETFKDGSELLNPDGSINHKALGQCYRSWEVPDQSRPVPVYETVPTQDENGNWYTVEQVKEITFPYMKTVEGWSTSCEKAVTRQALAQINNAITINDKIVDTDTILTSNIYTKSKVPIPAFNYVELFDIDTIDKKTTHFAYEVINGTEVLNMEERIVALEGAVSQLATELCLYESKYTWCDKLKK